VYGKQWVNWPTYEPAGDGLYRLGQGINQVADLVHALKTNPGSRRHIVEGWNVAEVDAMALPPCHKTYQFHVADGRLSGILYQRSADLALGVPFNLWGAALFTRLLARNAGWSRANWCGWGRCASLSQPRRSGGGAVEARAFGRSAIVDHAPARHDL
jgi:thymidylate synthase